jgi:spore coat protein A, manganese oxidase
MVATDGGLMPTAQPVASYRHAGAERYEFLVDFSKYPVGTTVDLRNSSNKNNVDYDHTNKVMRFVVSADGDVGADGSGDRSIGSLPGTLVGSESMHLSESMARRRTRLRLERTNSSWAINGKTWKDVEDSDFRLFLTDAEPDDVELWEIENSSGGWFHPLHVHLVDFQVLDRNGRAPFAYERGPKDVVYVGEGETVRLLMKFTLQQGGGSDRNAGGKYMVHCHNLPHEDHDMMLQFCVGDDEANDPMATAPARPDTGDYPDEFVPAQEAVPAEPEPEPVETPEPTDTPTSEATPAPAQEATPAPVEEATPAPEPSADATPEPAADATPTESATPAPSADDSSTPGSQGRRRRRR